jgi:hypothetical protein
MRNLLSDVLTHPLQYYILTLNHVSQSLRSHFLRRTGSNATSSRSNRHLKDTDKIGEADSDNESNIEEIIHNAGAEVYISSPEYARRNL